MKTASWDNHNFEKQNSFTKEDKRGFFDLYKCTRCGLKGKRRSFGKTIEVDGRTSDKQINTCDGKGRFPKRIKIINCNAVGPEFAPLTPGSVHNVVAPPEEHAAKYPNTEASVWVMGATKPARLLPREFQPAPEDTGS